MASGMASRRLIRVVGAAKVLVLAASMRPRVRLEKCILASFFWLVGVVVYVCVCVNGEEARRLDVFLLGVCVGVLVRRERKRIGASL